LTDVADRIAVLTSVRSVRREDADRNERLGGTIWELRARFAGIPERLREIADDLENALK
jgi:hypothetical protein